MLGFLGTLLIGLIGGALAMLAVYRSFPNDAGGWVGALVIGVLGSWLGSLLMTVIGLEEANWIGSLVVAFAGASLILLGIRKITPQRKGR